MVSKSIVEGLPSTQSYRKRKRVQLDFGFDEDAFAGKFHPSRSLTKQDQMHDSDINVIVRRHHAQGVDLLKQGMLASEFSEEVLDASPIDFNDAMNRIAIANETFESLPSAVRSEFKNDPHLFVNFATNPANKARMVELGLAKAPLSEADTTTQTLGRAPMSASPAGNEASDVVAKKSSAKGA